MSWRAARRGTDGDAVRGYRRRRVAGFWIIAFAMAVLYWAVPHFPKEVAVGLMIIFLLGMGMEKVRFGDVEVSLRPVSEQQSVDEKSKVKSEVKSKDV